MGYAMNPLYFFSIDACYMQLAKLAYNHCIINTRRHKAVKVSQK